MRVGQLMSYEGRSKALLFASRDMQILMILLHPPPLQWHHRLFFDIFKARFVVAVPRPSQYYPKVCAMVGER